MNRAGLAAVMVALALPGLADLPQEAEGKRIAESASGIWEMDKKADHPFPLLMIIRQQGNLYPSFWVGRNTGGRLVINCVYDLLDGLSVSSEGGFSGALTHTSNRPGMLDKIPGGPWAVGLRERPIRVEFKQFSDFKHLPEKTGKREITGLTFQARYQAVLAAPTGSAALEGTGEFFFLDRIPSWLFSTKVTVKGADLGLPAPMDGELEVQIFTRSSVSRTKPAPTPVRVDVLE